MRVKINKVIPSKNASTKIKLQPFVVGNEQYLLSPNKIDQRNYTGFPIYLQLICTLPDATLDYDYVKFNIVAQSADYKETVERKAERFDDIKKGQHRRDFVFSFLPLKKGLYTIKLDAFYRPKYIVNGQPQLEQKKQSMQMSLKLQDPFEISELFVTEDKNNSITFPLLIQHTILSKLLDDELSFNVKFQSEMFNWKFMNDKNQFSLKPNQAFYTLLSVKPQTVKRFLSEKPQTIGQLSIRYGEKGQLRKKINFRTGDKYLFFKGTTVNKTIAKRDIVEVVIRFEKIHSANFGLGDLSIVINQNMMEGIKVVKTSKSRINLDQNKSQEVVFSIICLKSGFYQLKGNFIKTINTGLTLNTNDNRIVNFVNDITLFVQNERDDKEQVFQNTTVVTPIEQESLI